MQMPPSAAGKPAASTMISASRSAPMRLHRRSANRSGKRVPAAACATQASTSVRIERYWNGPPCARSFGSALIHVYVSGGSPGVRSVR